LTPAQARVLGKSRIEGALVTLIAYGGPADSAGLRFLDLITEVDGVKVRNADHLVSILGSAAPGATLTFACLVRAEAADGAAPAGAWTTKTVAWTKGP
jgi:S1-C subfamily serine protease